MCEIISRAKELVSADKKKKKILPVLGRPTRTRAQMWVSFRTLYELILKVDGINFLEVRYCRKEVNAVKRESRGGARQRVTNKN